jgi:hypothetical protein
MTLLPRFVFVLAVLIVQKAPAESRAPRQWNEYRTIMWVGDSFRKKPDRFPLFVQRLREMGINSVTVHGDAEAKPWTDTGLAFYVENVISKGLCLKFNSPVTNWDAFVAKWAKNGRSVSDFVRPYSLDDPEWLKWGAKRMKDFAAVHKPHHPFAVDIRDELSTTNSANPFDYDFSEHTLKAFRTWLQTEYSSLDALNAQWETKFTAWDEVKPFTTDQIKNRMASGKALPEGNPDWHAVQQIKFTTADAAARPTAWNFSPWADFRTYMDLSLARTLAAFRDASRGVDPDTPVGIEGTQMPHAFGGYDLWRLSQALDWVEPYDICNSREIFGSFMPGKPILTTVGEKDARAAQRRLWHLHLLGDRGCIIWWSEDCIDWNKDDWPLTSRAKGLAPVLKTMTSPLARLFLRAKREVDPVFIHYSQPSVQVAWLMESTGDGSTWVRRFSSYEASHNRHARVREGWVKVLQDLGYTPQFVHGSQLASLPQGASVVLPESWALSNAEQTALTALPAGSVCGTGAAGVMDEHGKLRSRGALVEPAKLPSSAGSFSIGGENLKTTSESAADYAAERLKAAPPQNFPAFVASAVKNKPPVIIDAAARVYCHRYQLPKARLLAFERNISWQMSEDLSQAGGNEVLEKPADITVGLPAAAHLYDLRTGQYLGHKDSITFTIDPWQPSLFAACPEKLPEGDVIARLTADQAR